MSQICVIGSGSFDLFLCVDHFPLEGETINTTDSFIKNGGKGANQAVAAAKLGSSTSFVGQFGKDKHGDNLIEEMSQSGVDMKYLLQLEDVQTGQAIIIINKFSQNSIVIVGGANMHYPKLDSLHERFYAAIDQAQLVQMQKEIPIEINLLAAQYAKSKGKLVMLDLGGRDDEIPDLLLNNVDFISPNETEFARLMKNEKISELKVGELISVVRSQLLSKFPKLSVLLKLGENGSCLITGTDDIICPAVTQLNEQILKEYAILDTTGAGDCFTSAFCVKYLELALHKSSNPSREQYLQCLRFANSSAFLAITVKGAMPSMPSRILVDQFQTKFNLI